MHGLSSRSNASNSSESVCVQFNFIPESLIWQGRKPINFSIFDFKGHISVSGKPNPQNLNLAIEYDCLGTS